ncbi:hypothetical protein GW781_12730 [bacterium]|nr:hypothetical protein [bacterium]NCT22004.1 hypothetical protein [bacterium]OIO86229.1 MAG: hypothetical protein AUK01_03940 [Anaerolineae bacterium CG2_30_57_67]
MTFKDLLAKIPYSADLYDAVRRSRPRTRYNLEQLRAHLPAAVEQARSFIAKAPAGKKIVLFASLHYWVEQAAILALTLRGLGHEVTIAYWPYGDWRKEINAFDLRRQDLYTRRALKPLAGLVKIVSLLESPAARQLPAALEKAVETVAAYDAMYTNQEENVDINGSLYRLRLARNRQAAWAALRLLTESRPDSVLIPNGTITELGAVYHAARHLGLDTVTYEFNDQREQIWIARNDEVMRQNTDALWAARGGRALLPEQREKIEALEAARMGGRAFGKSARKWQEVETVGGEKMRADLGLDARPVVLLATNVLGDSLTLGRNIFAASMAEWITRTVQYFAGRADAQLLIRVHPGERLTHGKSMVDVVREALPHLPENMRVIGPLEKVNTYDLMEISALGLVYTTTTGMEMALRGLPVIACGETHYRRRGFTFDPLTYDEYFAMLDNLLSGYPVRQLSGSPVGQLSSYPVGQLSSYPVGQLSSSPVGLTEQPDSRNTGQPDNRTTEQPNNRNTEQPNNRTTGQPEYWNTDQQIETAWEYAYRFFFEYPFPFPWRLMHFWKDLEVWPLERVLSAEGRAEFGKIFDYLAGNRVKW